MLELTTTGDDRLLDLMKHLATTSVWEHYDGGMVCAISEIGQYFPKRISVELRYSANILVNKAAAKGRNLATPFILETTIEMRLGHFSWLLA
ncbi:uncharacterized protein RSE6_04631 [Rhynchosporium secalis]|uniref:Uncharacterized protein n=1 Tax=Rhynchosporium secalis TaxID=38038 RepID=A0A1E1M5S9_RHYSE|nr:uncharacterized protein RSE6_04631 [Rhynchosporium secalis]